MKNPRIMEERELLDSTGGTDLFQERVQTLEDDLAKASEKLEKFKRIAKEAQEREHHFRSMIENQQDLFLTISSEGVIKYCSPSMEDFGGYDHETETGEHISKYFENYEEFTIIESQLRNLAFSGRFAVARFVFRPSQGESFLVESSLNPVLEQGALSEIHCVLRDIRENSPHRPTPELSSKGMLFVETDRVTKEKLRQKQRLESIGTLAGGIAHDFNNLLVPIITYSEIALMGTEPEHSHYEYFEQILEAANRAKSLTQQLLAFGRKQVLNFKIIDLNNVVHDSEKMLRRLIGENIMISTELDAEVGNVKADRSQLLQVLMNLAVNSRDAMPDGGTMTIQTKKVYIQNTRTINETYPDLEPGHYASLHVQDTGIGMDSQTKRRLFEPFYTTKLHQGGTGLGLSTVHGIVTQHKGYVSVESEKQKGTTISVYLPTARGQSHISRIPAIGTAKAPRNATVLIAEDDSSVRKLAVEILEECGYTVLQACDGKDAQRIAEEYDGEIHLLLTDVIMPHINGNDLFEKIRLNIPNLKVLYFSGYTDDVIEQHGVLQEAVDFLQKPFSVRSLTESVRNVLEDN